MKRSITTLLMLTGLLVTTHAQEILKHKWHRFFIGGDKGYFVKTNTFSNTTMTEDQFGSGGNFDNSPMEIKIAELYTTPTDERVITDYGDSSYYVIVFKNFTAQKASVCLHTEVFTTIEAAKAFVPDSAAFTDWFTEAGYKAEDKKPVLPEMTKKDAISFVQFFTNVLKDVQAAAVKTEGEKEMKGFAAAMLLSALPAKYAESRGYNAYKSMPVIERGLKKYKNDPEIKKLLKEAGLPNVK
ncbi:MAG: hypothetical protein NTW29_15515 [Bacteroidetes bacterium]|nr:hypothetical protein [Bacteroidota bacterium]